MAKLVHNVQKKQHRERGQTTERSKYGFLEKHKDYVKRAQNFHKKEKTLKILREKAQERNPDEFYYGMHTKRIDPRTGLLVKDRGGSEDDGVLTMDQVKLLKSQDVNYVKTLRQENMMKINKLKNELGFKSKGDHKIFVDDVQEMNDFTPEKYFNTTTEMLDRKENRLRLDQMATFGDEDFNADTKKNVQPVETIMPKQSLDKKKLKKFKIMQQYLQREHQLTTVYEKMVQKNELLKNGSKKKVQVDDGKAIFKWKKQRKK
ncbi:Small subunit (SSU) processome component [Hanseniaspora vineae]